MTFALLLITLAGADVGTTKPATEQVIERMVAADERRSTAFPGYTGLRRYQLTNKAFRKQAELTIRVTCKADGRKTSSVVSESGSQLLRARILRKVVDAELEASRSQEGENSRITPRNYEFRFAGTEVEGDRTAYVFAVTPRQQNRFLIRGRIWVDAEEYVITRVEGSPAKMPSFWTKSVHIMRRYTKVGPFWLPSYNYSDAEARIFGHTEMIIEYSDYRIAEQEVARDAVPSVGR